MIKPGNNSFWLLLKKDHFINFPDYKTFHVAMLQSYKGFWVFLRGAGLAYVMQTSPTFIGEEENMEEMEIVDHNPLKEGAVGKVFR